MKKNTLIILTVILLLSATVHARTDIAAFCYHQVEPSASGKFSLTLEKFKNQLDYLKKRNYKSLNSEELLAAISTSSATIENQVVITFDDGFKTVYDYAFPAMQEAGFKGIVCVYPSFIGSRLAMTWQQLKELIKAGWSVECHSMSHTNLSSLHEDPAREKAFLQHEIVAARQIIESKLGNRVKLMVWPYGVYTQNTIQTIKDADFAGAMTVDGGANYKGISPYMIKRQVIYNTDDMDKFLMRFGMAALPLTDQHPQPGQVVEQLATFSCKIANLSDYSPEKYVLNAKTTGKKVSFSFDQANRTLTASVASNFAPGNYFIDIYLRDKKTGVTAQNGWLFTVAGENKPVGY
ncbi:MAG: polysaccharide deacetylase family protein [Erysipelotrichia bacterium]|nr:polysaccharide deacetylase family protein [Erysipelotrichia bacterium]